MFQGEQAQHILGPVRMARVQVCFRKREMITEDSGEKFFKTEPDPEGPCKQS